MSGVTIGVHNLGDERGTPTGFADILFFTEAIPANVHRALSKSYVIEVCRWQKDLIIAWRRDLDIKMLGKPRYLPAHPGIRKVTPHRGTFVIKVLFNGRRTKLICEHRINAAFPPYVRGERTLRPRFWNLHTRITLGVIRRAVKRGWDVIAGGDLNTPNPRVQGYRGLLHEVGSHFDRLGSTGRLHSVEVLARMGSDHQRLRAVA